MNEILEKSDLEVNNSIDDVFINLKSIYYKNVSEIKISTGVEVIDKLSGEIAKGTLTTVFGYTGSGKTTYACNMAYKAIKNDINSVYISLEVSKAHIYYNFLSRFSYSKATQIEHIMLKRGTLDKNYEKYLWEELYKEFSETYKKYLYVIDETDISSYSTDGFNIMLNEIDTYVKNKTGKGIELLFIDHIQLLKFESNGSKTNAPYTVTNNWISYFRQQAINFLNTKKQIAIVLLSQANREGWEYAVKHDGKYTITALAEANELERTSSMVISVFSSDILKMSKEVKLQLLKCRDGQTMIEPINILFDPAYYILCELEQGDMSATFDNIIDIKALIGNTTDDFEDLLKPEKTSSIDPSKL